MEIYNVIGKQSVKSNKNGKIYDILHCTKDFGENQTHCDGIAVETLFFEHSKDISVGSVVTPVYSKGFNGQAILDRVEVLEDSNN